MATLLFVTELFDTGSQFVIRDKVQLNKTGDKLLQIYDKN